MIAKPAKANGTIQIRVGGPTGRIIGRLSLASFRARKNYTLTARIVKTSGVQNVYLVLVGRKQPIQVNSISVA